MSFNIPCPACKKPVKNGASKCPHCHTVYSAQQMDERKRGAKMGFIGLGVAALALCLAVYACSGGSDDSAKPTAEAPAQSAVPDAVAGTVAASDRQIVGVDVYSETAHANVKADLAEGWDEASLPDQAAAIVEAAGKAIKAGKSEIVPGIETVTFWFTSPLDDGTRGKVMQFRILSSDLRTADYANLPPAQLLNYASDVEVKYRAREGVAEFCASNASTNRAFCAAAIKQH